MRRKRIFAAMLVLALMVSCFGVNVSAMERTQNEGEPFVVSRAMGEFDMEVPGNTSVKASSSFPLEVGEVVTIKATYWEMILVHTRPLEVVPKDMRVS